MRTQTLKIMMISLIALASMFGTVGCSKDKKGNSSYSGYGFGGYGYGSTPGSFLALGNESSGRLQLGLEFGIVGGGAIGQSTPVQAGGELHVMQGLSCGYSGAGLAPGVWSVRTIQPGYISVDGALQSLVLEAQGPNGVARMTIANGMIFSLTPKTISCSGAPGFDELAAMVRVDTVNGFACNASFSVYLLGSASVCGGF